MANNCIQIVEKHGFATWNFLCGADDFNLNYLLQSHQAVPWTASLHALAFQAPSFDRSVDHWGKKLPAFPKPSNCPVSPKNNFPSVVHTAQAQQWVRRATLGFCFKFPRGTGEIHPVQEKRELLLLLERFFISLKNISSPCLVLSCSNILSLTGLGRIGKGLLRWKREHRFQSADKDLLFPPWSKKFSGKSLGKKIFLFFFFFLFMNHFNIFPCVSDHLRAMYSFSKLQRGEALSEVEISSIPKILVTPRDACRGQRCWRAEQCSCARPGTNKWQKGTQKPGMEAGYAAPPLLFHAQGAEIYWSPSSLCSF